MSELRITRRTLATVVAACLVLAGMTAVVAGAGAPLLETTTADGVAVDDPQRSVIERDSGATLPVLEPDDETGDRSVAARNDEPPIEDEYVEAVPEPGDEYFEAAADDGSWVSYDNPRDEYRSPYLGDGSGKLCVTLLNEDGEVVVGETVPDTTVTIPTGDSLSWHEHADPMTVELPLTDHYDRPLDADQFGTSSDVAQGDGYLDAHCIEIHGLPEDETVEYGEPQVDGAYADWIDVVGYVQQAHDTWDTNVDPIDDAVAYEEAGGWTYRPDGSHGQAVVVLQLDPPDDAYASTGDGALENEEETDDGGGEETTADGDDGDEPETMGPTTLESETEEDGTETESEGENENEDVGTNTDSAESETGSETSSDDDPLPGFGASGTVVAIATLAAVFLARARG